MKRDLLGKKLVVTGAARGIGEKVARLAAARGARVTVIGLEADRLRALADELGPTAVWREADVRDGAALRSAIDEAADVMGGIDLVVANAGVVAYGTVRQTDETSFERVLDINLNGVFRTLKYATPHLERSRGHVLVVASALSFMPLAAMASYGASKAAAELLALTYRQEVAHLGVTVGLVHPSWIDTDLVRGAEADLLLPGAARAAALSGQRHHERRPGGRRDRRRARAPTQPRVRAARGPRGQLGEGSAEFALGLALGKAFRGPCGSLPRTGGRGVGEARPAHARHRHPCCREQVVVAVQGCTRPPSLSGASGDRVVQARAGLVGGLGTFPAVTQPDGEVHAHRPEHLRHGVLELDEMLGQFEGDVPMHETPQLGGDDFGFLPLDPAGAHEPVARGSDMSVGFTKGRGMPAQAKVRIRKRPVRRPSGQAEHQVVEVRVLVGQPTTGQGHGEEIRDRVLRHRYVGERSAEFLEPVIGDSTHELGNATEVAVDHHRRQSAGGSHRARLQSRRPLLGQQTDGRLHKPFRCVIKPRPPCHVSHASIVDTSQITWLCKSSRQ